MSEHKRYCVYSVNIYQVKKCSVTKHFGETPSYANYGVAILGSHGGEREVYRLPGRNAAWPRYVSHYMHLTQITQNPRLWEF